MTRWSPQRPTSGRAVVIAPHPDDEVLGPGGTLAMLAEAGADIVHVAVTDGEASHPGYEELLRRMRPRESARAAVQLGAVPSTVHRLNHADGRIEPTRLATELTRVIRMGDLVLAPWSRDGHPDHDRTGVAALMAAHRRGADVLAYLVWTWHWATPDTNVPWNRACRVDLEPEVARRKRRATDCFTTQITGPNPILPVTVLDRLTRPFEVFLLP
jgi:LmbE family N-acetylglucosaminyl deacetylase